MIQNQAHRFQPHYFFEPTNQLGLHTFKVQIKNTNTHHPLCLFLFTYYDCTLSRVPSGESVKTVSVDDGSGSYVNLDLPVKSLVTLIYKS